MITHRPALLAGFLLALLSACSPPPKPYAPAAKAQQEGTKPDAPPLKTVPADLLTPDSPRIETLKFGESCIVTGLDYRVDDSRSLWIDPKGHCAGGRTIFKDIRVIRVTGGYKASLLGNVSGHQNSAADLNLMGYQRVLEIIP